LTRACQYLHKASRFFEAAEEFVKCLALEDFHLMGIFTQSIE